MYYVPSKWLIHSLGGRLLRWLNLRCCCWRWWLTASWFLWSWLSRRPLFRLFLCLLRRLEEWITQHLFEGQLLLLLLHTTAAGESLELLVYLHYLMINTNVTDE